MTIRRLAALLAVAFAALLVVPPAQAIKPWPKYIQKRMVEHMNAIDRSLHTAGPPDRANTNFKSASERWTARANAEWAKQQAAKAAKAEARLRRQANECYQYIADRFVYGREYWRDKSLGYPGVTWLEDPRVKGKHTMCANAVGGDWGWCWDQVSKRKPHKTIYGRCVPASAASWQPKKREPYDPRKVERQARNRLCHAAKPTDRRKAARACWDEAQDHLRKGKGAEARAVFAKACDLARGGSDAKRYCLAARAMGAAVEVPSKPRKGVRSVSDQLVLPLYGGAMKMALDKCQKGWLYECRRVAHSQLALGFTKEAAATASRWCHSRPQTREDGRWQGKLCDMMRALNAVGSRERPGGQRARHKEPNTYTQCYLGSQPDCAELAAFAAATAPRSEALIQAETACLMAVEQATGELKACGFYLHLVEAPPVAKWDPARATPSWKLTKHAWRDLQKARKGGAGSRDKRLQLARDALLVCADTALPKEKRYRDEACDVMLTTARKLAGR